MKKVMFILATIILTVILVGCNDEVKDKGEIPTKPFTVNSYLDSNAVYEGNSKLTVSGESDANVVIHLELISKNNKTVDAYETTVNEKNLSWSITFDTPRPTDDNYKIRIRDAHSTYVYEYTNIRFGYLWLVAGDGFINYPIELSEDEKYNSLDEISFYEVSSNSHWLTNSEKLTNVSSFDLEFARLLQKKLKAPIGIIVGDEHSTLIEEWLPLDAASSIGSIYNYLQNLGKYNENPNYGDACYLFEKELKHLKGLSLSGIIWNQGEKQAELFNNKQYEKIYFQMLTSIIQKWCSYFNTDKMVLLQTPSNYDKYTNRLRYIQNIAANYYRFVEIIPTFDLYVKENDKIIDVDVDSVASRTVEIITGSKRVSSYANLILDINEDDIVDQIKIEFDNVKNINVIDSETINYLVVKYQDEKLGLITLDIVPKVDGNYLIFDLSYETEITDENGGIVKVTNYYNKSLISIEFGQVENLENINIFNEDMIPILPFIIEIE